VGSPSRLAGAIERVMADDSLRARLIEAGREEVKRRFSWEGVWGRYVEVLRL